MAPETISLIYERAVTAIQRLCNKASLEENSKMILTEADLQSWIFCYLQRHLADDLEIGGATDNGRYGVHSQTSFLDEYNRLRIRPDVIIIPKEDYSVVPESKDSLYWRKGYSAWGSSIAIELKILRTCSNAKNEFRKWRKDINKLHQIRSHHYSNSSEKCFPLFVLFCREELSNNLSDNLKKYAMAKEVNLILSIVGRTSSYHKHESS